MTTKCAAIYVRCSTHHQDIDLQQEQLIDLAKRRGWTIYNVYSDQGISGGKDSRPALDLMMQDARRKAFDVVAVWRFDRFGRSTAHLVNALNEFHRLGIDFVSLNEAVDTSTPSGRVLFSVIAAMAEFERALIQERVKAGVARAQANGVKFGRPHKGFDVARAIEMKQAGASYRQIAKKMGVSHVTVHKALKDC